MACLVVSSPTALFRGSALSILQFGLSNPQPRHLMTVQQVVAEYLPYLEQQNCSYLATVRTPWEHLAF